MTEQVKTLRLLIKPLFLLLILLWLSCPAPAAEKTVSVATLPDYAPFCFLDREGEGDGSGLFPPGRDSGRFTGYNWDILRESFHEMGYTIKLSVLPWARALFHVKGGRADILFPTGKNSERRKIFHYSEEPVNHSSFLVYVRKDSSLRWQGLESLRGLTIGVKRGFNYGDKWSAATYIRKHEVEKIMQGFKMLDLNRIDGFLGYEINWDYMLKQAGWRSKYRKLPVFDSSGEYLVALKTNPRALELLTAFDSGKRRLILNGKFAEIQKKWLVEE